jgi:diphosphomevalonate decarboxylase
MGGSQSYPAVSATHTAPSNIALIKYWGKRDLALNTPLNSSVSLTLGDDLKATTTVVAHASFERDRLWLNGEEVDLTARDLASTARVRAVLTELRRRARDAILPASATPGGTEPMRIPREELRAWRVHIVSRNNFPTAAGLASSAAGYAALVRALADVYCVREAYPGELSAIARQGSGSACRSLAGGLVEWQMGRMASGSDSLGVQVHPAAHWPQLALLIAVVSGEKKATGSTAGMVRAVETSELLRHRAGVCVPRRLEALKAAFAARDFAALARLTMEDSNQFHATCLDTYPPVFYMNDVSKRIVGLVHALNAAQGEAIAAYTFDAGPNAVLLTTQEHAPRVLAALLAHFPPPPAAAGAGAGAEGGAGSGGSSSSGGAAAAEGFVTGEALGSDLLARAQALVAGVVAAGGALAPPAGPLPTGLIKHVYATRVGDGPKKLSAAEALADPTTGLPLSTEKVVGMDRGME